MSINGRRLVSISSSLNLLSNFHLAHAPKAYDPDDHIDYLDATVHFDDTCQVWIGCFLFS